jgi:hypothetical protein
VRSLTRHGPVDSRVEEIREALQTRRKARRTTGDEDHGQSRLPEGQTLAEPRGTPRAKRGSSRPGVRLVHAANSLLLADSAFPDGRALGAGETSPWGIEPGSAPAPGALELGMDRDRQPSIR